MSSFLFQTEEFNFGTCQFLLSFSTNGSGNHLVYRLRLVYSEDSDVRIDSGIYAYDVNRFLDEVEILHRTLEGTATLTGAFDDRFKIVISVDDAGTGKLTISGSYVPPWDYPVCKKRKGGVVIFETATSFAGVRVQFDGIRTDQSYLPGFLTRMREFFREADVDTSVYF